MEKRSRREEMETHRLPVDVVLSRNVQFAQEVGRIEADAFVQHVLRSCQVPLYLDLHGGCGMRRSQYTVEQ